MLVERLTGEDALYELSALMEHPQATRAMPEGLLGVSGVGAGLGKVPAGQGDGHGGAVR